MPSRKAEAEWKGNLIQGAGRLAVESGAFEGPYTFKSRIEDGQSAANPEELLGASHAGCFTMALAAELSRAGFGPTHLQTGASVAFEKIGEAFAIPQIELETLYSGHRQYDLSEKRQIRQTELFSLPLLNHSYRLTYWPFCEEISLL